MKAIERCSIIIPSVKYNILTEASECPCEHEILVVRDQGIGYARNQGARKAAWDLLVFMDDDLRLSKEVWQHVLATQPNEFRMMIKHALPCSRIMSIHKDAFWRLGGFDESIKYAGEDREFFLRAIDHGLRFTEIPLKVAVHYPHVPRRANFHVALRIMQEGVKVQTQYNCRYSYIFRRDLLQRVKSGQVRTLLLRTIFLLSAIARRQKPMLERGATS